MKKLLALYYTIYALAVATACGFWYIFVHQHTPAFLPASTAGLVIQYSVIGYVLLSVSLGLFLFKKACDKLKKETDEAAKIDRYTKYAAIRIIVIGLGIILGIAAFYALSGYQSMIWCAAISAIGLFFCKPDQRRMELELQNDENPE